MISSHERVQVTPKVSRGLQHRRAPQPSQKMGIGQSNPAVVYAPGGQCLGTYLEDTSLKKIYISIYISDITPDPGGHRPQRPCAQGRTCAEQDYAQEAAPAQTKDQTVGKATTNGRTTKQEGEGRPTPTPTETAPCTPGEGPKPHGTQAKQQLASCCQPPFHLCMGFRD